MKHLSLFFLTGFFALTSHAQSVGMGFLEYVPSSKAEDRVMLHSDRRLVKGVGINFMHKNEIGQIMCCTHIPGSAFAYRGKSSELHLNDEPQPSGFLYALDPKKLTPQKSKDVSKKMETLIITPAVIGADAVKERLGENVTATRKGVTMYFERCLSSKGVYFYHMDKKDKVLRRISYFMDYGVGGSACPSIDKKFLNTRK